MYPFLKDASFRPCFFCVHTIAEFSRILRFSHIYCQFFRIVPFVDGSRYKINGPVTTTEFRMYLFNDRVRKVPKISPDIILARYFKIMTKRKRNYQSTVRYSYMVKLSLQLQPFSYWGGAGIFIVLVNFFFRTFLSQNIFSHVKESKTFFSYQVEQK